MPTAKHLEVVFEDEIVAYLTDPAAARGWEQGDAKSYDPELALDPAPLLAFIQATQPGTWAAYKAKHNGQSEAKLLKRIAEQLDKHGTLHVLRRGVKDVSTHFQLCQFKPAHDANPATAAAYAANRLTVTRQVHYSKQKPHDALDLVLFVNGIPVATAELKTDTTQNVRDAIAQYMADRTPLDPKSRQPEPLLQFKTRALVHFAVSCDEVWMTTRLAGKETLFRPFNLGHDEGAGNPPNPAGYATSYLWERFWARDAWLDILGRFLHLEQKEVVLPDGKKKTAEALIFPRVHQWEAVTALVGAARTEGAGQTYLVQHSAGSGKSNSIGWLAHQLSSLHDAKGKPVFNTVVVITDRTVLDSQLQDTIYQFEQVAGVVQKIDEDSTQLATALKGGAKIIVCTLQKFPFVMDKVGSLAGRRFAVIVDEAHSSQTGTAATKLRKVLADIGAETPEEEELSAEDVMLASMKARVLPKNVSYFAFTATPKPKTVELFGRPGADGLPAPYHVYSMRQAIEEEYILDVLRNYVSYKTFFRLAAEGAAGEVEVDSARAKRTLAKYVRLHPSAIAQKVEIVVEHFREKVRAKIGGRAKAMVVTSSRKEAVRWKLAIDRFLKAQQYKDVAALVAFSGSVSDAESGPSEFTEGNMNPGLNGRTIPEAFATDEFQVMLVANKYLTGFDQPLLHTMYVDKKLKGVYAVQTLSRLNRTSPGKTDTFVLDFVNDPEEVLSAFQRYYRTARLESVTDPNIVHDLQTKLDGAHVYLPSEVDAFAKAFFDPKGRQAAMQAALKPAGDRWKALPDEERDEFRGDLASFVRLYEFLSQITPYDDEGLEKLAVFGRMLMPRLEDQGGATAEVIEGARLTHFRVQKQAELTLKLEEGEGDPLRPATAVGSGSARTAEQVRLAEIVAQMNDLFQGDLTEADLVTYATHITGKLIENDELAEQADHNSKEQFALGDYHQTLLDAVIDGLDTYQGMAGQVLNSEKTRRGFADLILDAVYDGLRARRAKQRGISHTAAAEGGTGDAAAPAA